jgi:hypothetical protein
VGIVDRVRNVSSTTWITAVMAAPTTASAPNFAHSWEYEQTVMTLNSINVTPFNLATYNNRISDSEYGLFRLNLNTERLCDAQKLNNINLKLNNNTGVTVLKNVRIYSTGSNTTFNINTAGAPIAIQPVSTIDDITVSITNGHTLLEGDNNF